MRKALFLDRDGTLIEDADYLREPSQVKLLPGAADAVRLANDHGWLVILVTNQSGVGRGMFTVDDVERVHAHLKSILDARLDAIYFCPHAPEDGCACRKPNPGMLLQAAAAWDVDRNASVMIGDKVDDVIAGLAAGCQAVRVEKNSGQLATIVRRLLVTS